MLVDTYAGQNNFDSKAFSVIGIVLQSVVAIVAILYASFSEILGYVGILLNLFAMCAISGLFRIAKPTLAPASWFWSHRVCPGLFVSAVLGMTLAVALENPRILAWSDAVVFFGLGVCLIYSKQQKRSTNLFKWYW